tara:strand:+ start:363 stop:548 length:186 start_codon:yes stop_codon:yes gene_type:complete
MKTAEQKQHEADMIKKREAFALLWRNEIAASAKALGIHPTPATEHLAWLAFKAGTTHIEAI